MNHHSHFLSTRKSTFYLTAQVGVVSMAAIPDFVWIPPPVVGVSLVPTLPVMEHALCRQGEHGWLGHVQGYLAH